MRRLMRGEWGVRPTSTGPRSLSWAVAGLVALAAAGGLVACGDIQIPPTEADAQGGLDTGVSADAGQCDPTACDDQDPCTADTCGPDGACQHQPTPNSCAIEGVCYGAGDTATVNACKVCDPAQSTTSWSDLSCDDGNPCTADSCDANAGCQSTPDDSLSCDDGRACSSDDHCSGGQCVTDECECEVDADCSATEVPACMKAVCASYKCQITSDLSADGQPCEGQDKCLAGGACAAGTCAGGTPKDCSAEGTDACHPGVCDPGTGDCQASQADDGAECDDGDPCTVGDQCTAGVCGGTLMDCSDLDGPCTTGSCQAGSCQQEVHGGQACTPPNPCVVNATCTDAGTCLGSWNTEDASCACTVDADCDDSLGCTEDICTPGTGACSFNPLPGTCLIGGQCYFAKDTPAGNGCLSCSPDASATQWTPKICNDENPCTADSCDPVAGCVAQPDDAASCDDGNPCSDDDHCSGGQCVGSCECVQDVDCVGAAVEAGFCERAACVAYHCVAVPDAAKDGVGCDDGDLCTAGEVCAQGVCEAGETVTCEPPAGGCATAACDPTTGTCVDTFADAGAACDDGDPCTDFDACDGAGACGGVAKDCSPFSDACNVASCVAGQCVQTPTVGEPCDDGQVCTPVTACDGSGACTGAWDPTITGCGCTTDADCDDGLSCTVNTCSNDAECITTVKAGSCAIGGVCYIELDTRPDNMCQVCRPQVSKTGWQSLVCDDQNPCTDDLCDPGLGCLADNDDLNPCNDGDPCSSDDHCEAGACLGTCECQADQDCGGEVPACERWACQSYQCVAIPDDTQEGADCDDGLYCTVDDLCQAGACVGQTVRDCTAEGDGKCVQGVCDEFSDACVPQAAADGSTCEDGDPCTVDDACAGSACVGQPMDCSMYEDQCTSAMCSGGSCVTTPTTGTSCDDGEPCTKDDACEATGLCVGAWDAGEPGCGCQTDGDCAAQTDVCHVGRCEVSTGNCYPEPQPGGACDDGDPCTSGDACDETGLCGGAAYSCDDQVTCTEDLCDGMGGCTNDIKPGRCFIDGACYNGDEVNPNNPCQQCSGGDAWGPNDGVPCDDGDACTQGDICAGGACGGTPYTCDYQPQCQAAQCDGNGGCSVAPLSGWCVIGGQCVAAGEPNPANPCQSCMPAVSQAAWSNNQDACDDGDPCTKDDLCSGGACSGTAYPCGDGKTCTDDVCDGQGGCSNPVVPGSCVVDGACYADGDTQPGNPCEYCDAGQDGYGWTPTAQGVACNDGLTCTSDDACDGAGTCTGSLAGCSALACETPTCNAQGGCDVELKAGWCRIGGECFVDGDAEPNNPCHVCDAAANATGWTNTSAACDDGDPCTQKDTCAAGVCSGAPYTCDDGLGCTDDFCDGAGGCEHPLQQNTCLIGGKSPMCYAEGEPNPSNECQYCRPSASTTAWTNQSDGTTCASDGKPCTLDQCKQGSCSHSLDQGSGQCFISGVCYGDGYLRPGNDCMQCAAPATSWSNVASGASCASDGESCTTDACNGGGTCEHTALADYANCDDGSTASRGDWCYTGVCSGFEKRVAPASVCTGNNYAHARAYGSSGVHAVRDQYVSGGMFGLWWEHRDHFDGSTTPVVEGQGLGLFNSFFGLSPAYAVNGTALFAYDSGTDSWVNDTQLNDAWNAQPTDYQFSAVGSYYSFTGGSSLKAWGFDTSAKVAKVRSCWKSNFCYPQPCTPTWSCSDQSVSSSYASHVADCVGAGSIGGVTYFGCNRYSSYGDEYPTTLRVMGWDSTNSYWTSKAYLSVGGQEKRYRDFVASGSYAIGVGLKGVLRVTEFSDGSVVGAKSISVPGLSNQGDVDFTGAGVWDGRVWVWGKATVPGSGIFPASAVFYVAHAATTSNLRSNSSWQVHTVDTGAGGLCVAGAPCPAASDYVSGGAAGSGNFLYLFGGAWTGDENDRTDPTVWMWTKP